MAIALRSDFNAVAVRSFAKKSKDGPQARRLLALAAIYEGASRTEAAKIGGVTLQIVRDWVDLINSFAAEEIAIRIVVLDAAAMPRDASREHIVHRPLPPAVRKDLDFGEAFVPGGTPPNHGCAECRSPRRPSFRDR